MKYLARQNEFGFKDEPFRLVGEQGVDHAARQAEELAAQQARKDAEKQQNPLAFTGKSAIVTSR